MFWGRVYQFIDQSINANHHIENNVDDDESYKPVKDKKQNEKESNTET